MDCRSEGSLMVDNSARSKDIRSRCQGRLITFDMLPDDVLLEIFDICLDEDMDVYLREWIPLAHVCRRWRSVVFQSPHRLNLRLVCRPYTPVRDYLDIWPPLPLVISDIYDKYYHFGQPDLVDNIIATLEHNDRVYQIDLMYPTSSNLDHVTNSAAMQKPFPELTDLRIGVYDLEDEPEPILPDSFLAGTAPRLRSLELNEVPYPGILKLLLSTTHLIHLNLRAIPHSGYIPPEVMATSLSALTNLESLHLYFLSSRSRPTLGSRRRTPPPQTRSILPSLTEIRFKGASEYLEDILARIDAPRVKNLDISFFNQITFNTPQLFQFISRRPTLMAPEKGHITFGFRTVSAKFQSRTSNFGELRVEIICKASEGQLSCLGQICTSSLPPLSTLEDLSISKDRRYPPRLQGDIENTLWLELLRSFAAVKNLYLTEDSVHRIAPALQGVVGGRTTEVLPALESIFIEGLQPWAPLREDLGKFVAARRLTSHPVAVSSLDKERHWKTFSFFY